MDLIVQENLIDIPWHKKIKHILILKHWLVEHQELLKDETNHFLHKVENTKIYKSS
jgi:hypothetical protein